MKASAIKPGDRYVNPNTPAASYTTVAQVEHPDPAVVLWDVRYDSGTTDQVQYGADDEVPLNRPGAKRGNRR